MVEPARDPGGHTGRHHPRRAVRWDDGFNEHDSAALGELSAEELVGQYEARLALDEYVAHMREQARSGVRDPGVDPGLSTVAGAA
ncbi:MAG TPA: hypothetical protein VE196_03000 [Pseudonocardiaceae bacterium]|nr:hypothetical protein [Pseudonocardiaceae bacterium]